MSTFEEVKVSWKGQEAAIPANNVLRAIAKVESVLTVGELGALSITGAPKPLAKISMAYGLLLRHAGIKVEDDDIYAAMFSGPDTIVQAGALLNALIALMVPPEHMKEDSAKKDAAPNPAAASSAPPTEPQ